MALTPKQKRILDFLSEYRAKNGFAPSQKEIARHCRFSSLGTVQNYLKRLEQGGYVQKDWNARRGLVLASDNTPALARVASIMSSSGITLPLLGRVAAGQPIEVISDLDSSFEVPASMIKCDAPHFVLEVMGRSMTGEGIFPGDFLVVKKQPHAENGDTVVALVGGDSATVKKYFKKKSHIELHPANPAYPVQIIDEETAFQIEGLVVGLIRKWS
jgi:repressor LexA